MRRALLACLIAAASTTTTAAVAAVVPAPRATLEGFACQRASDRYDRAIEVTAVMRPMTGTLAMAMKFVLIRRAVSGGPYTVVPGKELGRWLTPTQPTLGQRPGDVWRLNKVVVNLSSPYAYRLRVSFRWTGKAGAALGRTLLESPVCSQ